MEIVNIYREIGKTLHALGAQRVVLLHSKATPNEKYEMSLEVAVDGMIDVAEADKVCRATWENIDMKLLDLNDYSNRALMTEAIEDGIQL